MYIVMKHYNIYMFFHVSLLGNDYETSCICKHRNKYEYIMPHPLEGGVHQFSIKVMGIRLDVRTEE